MSYLTNEQIERENNWECIDCGISIHDCNPDCNECIERTSYYDELDDYEMLLQRGD